MTRPPTGRHRETPPRRPRPGLALTALLAAAGIAVAVGLQGLPPAPAATTPATTPAPPSPTRTDPTIAPAGTLNRTAPADRRPPLALRIPAIGLSVGLTRLGLNPDRTVEVPTDFARPGWYRFGPVPGQRGSAVILGHVDSYRGPAVFARLRTLRPGDVVEVDLAGGTVARFAVREVETRLKRDFPAQQVYGDHGGRSLQLVTCGGAFDRTARSYLSNVIVSTDLLPT